MGSFASFNGLNAYFRSVALRPADTIAAQGLKDMQSLSRMKRRPCRHIGVHEIGQDYDMDGNHVRLVRCQRCGLLMREYLPIP